MRFEGIFKGRMWYDPNHSVSDVCQLKVTIPSTESLKMIFKNPPYSRSSGDDVLISGNDVSQALTDRGQVIPSG